MKIIFQFSICLFSVCLGEINAQNKIIIDADLGEYKISPHIYGHFSEHLGRCIYDGFYVGENNTKVPHSNGVRQDIIEALKAMKIPNLRWPGGCFADTYHWKDGVGPQSERPTIVNTWWGDVTEDNSFGTHNFLNLCEEIGAEPYITGNVGSGTVQEMSDWVQYTNFGGKSPMSDWREKNGRAEPWNVKYWGIGNEAWGCGGNMTAEYYANEYRKYVTFMKTNVGDGGRIYRIASGASDDDYHWTEVLMRDIPHRLLDAVAIHHYSVIDWGAKGSDVNFSEQQYFTTMKRALLMEELITRHANIMDKYDPTKKVQIVVDEWGGWYEVQEGTNGAFLYQQNTMRDAMIAGINLNIFNNHADRVHMANLAQTVNVLQAIILTEGEKMVLTPTYHVMEMYNVHFDATLLPIHLQTVDYQVGEDKLPAISASASRDAGGKVHISLTNIDAHRSQEIALDVRGMSVSQVNGRILKSDELQDHNTFEQPKKITPVSFDRAVLIGSNLSVTIPPFSVVVLELK